MNKDKMELEEAIKVLQKTVESNNEVIKEARKNGDINVMQLTADLDNQSIAIETVLQELENNKKEIQDLKTVNAMQEYRINEMDIPKKKIEEIYNNNEPMTITERVEFYQRKLRELLEGKNE